MAIESVFQDFMYSTNRIVPPKISFKKLLFPHLFQIKTNKLSPYV